MDMVGIESSSGTPIPSSYPSYPQESFIVQKKRLQGTQTSQCLDLHHRIFGSSLAVGWILSEPEQHFIAQILFKLSSHNILTSSKHFC